MSLINKSTTELELSGISNMAFKIVETSSTYEILVALGIKHMAPVQNSQSCQFNFLKWLEGLNSSKVVQI